MKQSILKLTALFAIFALMNCSKDDNGSDTISGSLEYEVAGTHQFEIAADNITATITIIGAGGGGGGGIEHQGFLTNSTGGGGGGGAGEKIVLENISFNRDLIYSVNIGGPGLGGTINNDGTNGQNTTITEGLSTLYSASAGNRGRSNTIGEIVGGTGGLGFPAGAKGGDGDFLDISWTAPAGEGGVGGNNGSGYGTGGTGGRGTAYQLTETLSPSNGLNGGSGYVLIEWRGKE